MRVCIVYKPALNAYDILYTFALTKTAYDLNTYLLYVWQYLFVLHLRRAS